MQIEKDNQKYRKMHINSIISLLFLIIALSGCSSINSVESWQSRYDAVWPKMHTTGIKRSTSSDSYQFYHLSYLLDANNAMLLATGDIKYLNRNLEYINNVIATAKKSNGLNFPESQYKDGFLGWANHSHSKLGNDGKEYVLFESIFFRYVCHLLRIIKETDWIFQDSTYKCHYHNILSFIEKNVFEKWYNRGRHYIYRSRTHMASHWAYIALELQQISSNTAWLPVYQEVYKNINSKGMGGNRRHQSLKRQMTLHPQNQEAYFWDSIWGSTTSPGQDVGHGNHVISYIVEAHMIEEDWSDADIKKLVKLVDIIWPKRDVFTKYIDGSGTGKMFLSDGWAKLGRFNKDLQIRLQTKVPLYLDTQLYGNGALNARILLDPSFSGTSAYSPTSKKKIVRGTEGGTCNKGYSSP